MSYKLRKMRQARNKIKIVSVALACLLFLWVPACPGGDWGPWDWDKAAAPEVRTDPSLNPLKTAVRFFRKFISPAE